MNFTLRLEFNHIYPSKDREKLIVYLKRLSKKTIVDIIGFFGTDEFPDYSNFFSNSVNQDIINNKILRYRLNNDYSGNIIVVSKEASLFLTEEILSNKNILIDNNMVEENIDYEELNLFKAFLVINENVNKSNNQLREDTEDNIEKIAQLFVSMKLPSSDLGLYDDISEELLKLAYVTSYKFEQLILFLKSDANLQYLIDDLCSYFGQKNLEKLKYQVDFLILQILIFRKNKSYRVKIDKDDLETEKFLQSLSNDKIFTVADFLNLRNYPIYRSEKYSYSIIEPFFVLDKFTKSTKFLLQISFNKKNNLKNSDRTFFNFYNKQFSEEFLMKNLLDQIFYKKYYVKKNTIYSTDQEPDYYFRYNNNIFIFEYKDILIAKEVKVSGDIDQILSTLKDKFLINPSTGKPIGIGQLRSHIVNISDNNFPYDNSINLAKNNKIHSVLLLSDRILEIPGVNYILNKWFKDNFPTINENLSINDLTVIDIDTLIFYSDYLKNKDRNFKDIIEAHSAKMRGKATGYGDTTSKFYRTFGKQLDQKLGPFSARFSQSMFNLKLFQDRFSYLIKN